MTERLYLHPESPQPRLLAKVVSTLRHEGVCVLPTDSGYSFACALGARDAMQQIARIRAFDKQHLFTLLVKDISSIANCARVNNANFRLLKAHTPGPFTFILEATKSVPKRLWQAKRKTIGVRIPDHPVAQAILADFDEPIMVVSFDLPEIDELYYYDIDWLVDKLDNKVDLILDIGNLPLQPTTIVDLTGESAQILRQGVGEL